MLRCKFCQGEYLTVAMAEKDHLAQDHSYYYVPPEMTDAEKEAQRRSFAFGNANISNPDVTREMIERAADSGGRMKAQYRYEGGRIKRGNFTVADMRYASNGRDECEKFVRSLNAHDDLLAACKEALSIVSDKAAGGRMLTSKEDAIRVFSLMRDAIAQAEVK